MVIIVKMVMLTICFHCIYKRFLNPRFSGAMMAPFCVSSVLIALIDFHRALRALAPR